MMKQALETAQIGRDQLRGQQLGHMITSPRYKRLHNYTRVEGLGIRRKFVLNLNPIQTGGMTPSPIALLLDFLDFPYFTALLVA